MAEQTFDVSIEFDNGDATVLCAGELDISTTAQLERALDRVFQRGSTKIALDCSAITFVDSSGVRSLMNETKRCREAGVAFSIRSSEAMQKVIDVLGVAPALGSPEDGHGISRTSG